MMFSHLASDYETLFNELNNGLNFNNPVFETKDILAARPTWKRNETVGFQTYAQERMFSNMNHDEAMATVNRTIIWR